MRDKDGFGIDEAVQDLNVSRETLAALSLIVSELHEWRQKMNLIGPREANHIWRRHVFDSLQLSQIIPPTARIVDLGSGAGFPGLVLAALAASRGGYVTMIESVGKKCTFLREVVKKAGLPATVLNERVEKVNDVTAEYVTARAFAPLPMLLNYAAPWLETGAIGVFPKGRRWQEELTQASDCWTFAHEVIPSHSGDGSVLKIWEVSRGD